MLQLYFTTHWIWSFWCHIPPLFTVFGFRQHFRKHYQLSCFTQLYSPYFLCFTSISFTVFGPRQQLYLRICWIISFWCFMFHTNFIHRIWSLVQLYLRTFEYYHFDVWPKLYNYNNAGITCKVWVRHQNDSTTLF